jgi:branched-chain amino acid transport system ATP-binding protein
VLQDSSLFPDMTVEQNLWLGGYLMGRSLDARQATERAFDRYPWLALRRDQPARMLSDVERRLLEISRALVMQPRLLLVDEPSIGLEPLYIERIFAMLRDLRDREGLTIVMVEQNAKKGLELADIGCVLVAGEVAMVGTGIELLQDPTVGRLFLGG